LRLTGRIDRVDHHPETGRWAILDFKTSDEPRTPEQFHQKGRPPTWCDLQLPLYRHLIRAVRSPEGRPLIPDAAEPELGFVRLSRELEESCCAIADWSADVLESADEAARDVVRMLRRGEVTFEGARAAFRGDPLAPLLGERQFLAADAEDGLLDAAEGET